jgi:hypothetical protein
VQAIYNRLRYDEEKAEAPKRLAGLFDTIINPLAGMWCRCRARRVHTAALLHVRNRLDCVEKVGC